MAKRRWLSSLAVCIILFLGYIFFENGESGRDVPVIPDGAENAAYVVLNDNVPDFTEADLTTTAYEYYSDLDVLGRCGYAMACVGQEIMPTEERGSIGQVKPSGWHTVKYDFVDGKYLYNRCHLLGYQLTGENANTKNLITGTRYMNVQGMLPFENLIAEYVESSNYHVLYRVTPVFEGDNLLADGVQMEAWSIEDEGAGVCFNVFVYNKEPGVTIDYNTGVSCETEKMNVDNPKDYLLDYAEKQFHIEDCKEKYSIISPRVYHGGREELIHNGYKVCKKCKP